MHRSSFSRRTFFLSFQVRITYNSIHIHNLYFALVSHSILSTRKSKEYSQLYELLTTFSHFNVLIMKMCVEQRFISSSSSHSLLIHMWMFSIQIKHSNESHCQRMIKSNSWQLREVHQHAIYFYFMWTLKWSSAAAKSDCVRRSADWRKSSAYPLVQRRFHSFHLPSSFGYRAEKATWMEPACQCESEKQKFNERKFNENTNQHFAQRVTQ